MKKFLLLISLFLPLTAFAELNVSKNGSVNYTRQSTAHWDSKPWSKSAISDSYYRRLQIDAMKARYEGHLSNQTVSGALNNTVSRQAVLSRAFDVAKGGARIASRAAPAIGTALLLKEAYDAVKGDLESEGYEYDPDSDEFLKYWDNRLCIWHTEGTYPNHKFVDAACIGVDSSTIRAYQKGGQSQKEAEYVMEAKMRRMSESYWPARAAVLDKGKSEWDFRWQPFSVHECEFDLNGGNCSVQNKGDIRNVISFSLKNQTYPDKLDSQKFLDIATGSIDSRPTPFVEASGRPEYKEEVSVQAGTVVTIGPVTTNEGPVQITITFTQNNGQTTAYVNITPRNDLTPNSPTAPSTGSSTGGNTGGQTGNDTGGNTSGQTGNDTGNQTGNQNNTDRTTRTELRPKPETGGGSQTDNETKPKEGDKTKEGDRTEQPQGGLLCEIFPNILACDELPEKEEPDLQIPEETINLNFSPENVFSEVGECPAPVTFQAMGATYAISLVPACTLAEMMRPFIIAMAWLVAAFFVARTVRNSV